MSCSSTAPLCIPALIHYLGVKVWWEKIRLWCEGGTAGRLHQRNAVIQLGLDQWRNWWCFSVRRTSLKHLNGSSTSVCRESVTRKAMGQPVCSHGFRRVFVVFRVRTECSHTGSLDFRGSSVYWGHKGFTKHLSPNVGLQTKQIVTQQDSFW